MESVLLITYEELRELFYDVAHVQLYSAFLIVGAIVAGILFRRK